MPVWKFFFKITFSEYLALLIGKESSQLQYGG